MTDKELATILIRHALINQRDNPEEYVEANADPAILANGNARVASMLELLGKYSMVSDVQPSFTNNGLGFAYRVPAALVEELTDEDLITLRVESALEGPPSETGATLSELLRGCEASAVSVVYRDDLLASLKELRICFTQECYIACLALAGKILEISLKQVLVEHDIEFDDKWMIGKLITVFQNANLDRYLDQSLPDIAKIINRSRIPAVHSVDRIPVPSKAQAVMVIHAVVDTVNRVIVKG
jgi:hypothetical protein